MTKLLLAISISLFGVSSFAQLVVTCKSFDDEASQGYVAKFSGRRAWISINGQKVAHLALVSSQKSPGPDQYSIARYNQKVFNGYSLEVKSGGFAGLTVATVLHGGFAGYVPVAELNSCK